MTAVDGFGLRTKGIDAETGDEVDLLDLAPQLVEHSSFVATAGERVARFAAVRHASYVHLRRLDRPAADRLQLVSDYTPGWRLSELLAESSASNIPVDITVVIALLRQLLPAVALYGRHNREAAIGTLAVERLIVTPQTRLVIAEHAFGPALEKLNLGRDRLWRELRIAMPASAGLPRANQRGDAHAIGVIALSLLLGRVLSDDEFPVQQALIESVKEYRDGQPSPLSSSFSNWLARALQIDVRTAFQAPSEAQLAFESVLASDRSYVTSSAKFEEWVSNVGGPIESRRPPSAPDPDALRQQELARQQEAQREQQRELERQQEAERDREQEAELARLRDLERQRAEELERLREQERQRALEVERLREQEREREQQREREREQERQRAQEAERLREQERQRAQEAERVREQEREREKAREKEREQAREKEREQERQREQQRQKERELDRERERARAVEQAAAAIAQTVEESAPPSAVEEDPIAAQIASYKPPVREVEEAPADEAPAPEAPAQAYEAPAQETPADEEPAPEPAYARQAQQAEPASAYTISEDTEKKSKLPLLALAGVILLLLAAVGWFATRNTGGGGMRAGEGELAVQSRPQGARVVVDGKESGVTPTTIRLPAGPHVLEVQVGKSEPRVIPLTITAGVQTSQYIELRDVSATGGLAIRSDPSGARITIDGQPRGTTPATIPNLSPGDHTVVLELGGRKVSQAVKIAPGSTQQLVIPIPRK
ncbi:MAG TPA: PEGA domain-containing protein [Vicinamibacterales bacterium]|nr:PEGA domain-containing protein [Vicinamibacterales bacterium]